MDQVKAREDKEEYQHLERYQFHQDSARLSAKPQQPSIETSSLPEVLNAHCERLFRVIGGLESSKQALQDAITCWRAEVDSTKVCQILSPTSISDIIAQKSKGSPLRSNVASASPDRASPERVDLRDQLNTRVSPERAELCDQPNIRVSPDRVELRDQANTKPVRRGISSLHLQLKHPCSLAFPCRTNGSWCKEATGIVECNPLNGSEETRHVPWT